MSLAANPRRATLLALAVERLLVRPVLVSLASTHCERSNAQSLRFLHRVGPNSRQDGAGFERSRREWSSVRWTLAATRTEFAPGLGPVRGCSSLCRPGFSLTRGAWHADGLAVVSGAVAMVATPPCVIYTAVAGRYTHPSMPLFIDVALLVPAFPGGITEVRIAPRPCAGSVASSRRRHSSAVGASGSLWDAKRGRGGRRVAQDCGG